MGKDVNYGVPRNKRFIVEALVTGLRRLEYRGYDSAGLCVDGLPSEPLIFREAGKVDALVSLLERTGAGRGLEWGGEVDSHVGVAHTRWATHGPPVPRNAHPHTSDDGNAFVVVHNGIVTNHAALREMLTRKGCVFGSDTDTEARVFAATAGGAFTRRCRYDSMEGKKDDGAALTFLDVVSLVVVYLEGAFALIFKSPHFPGQVVATKRGSPLLLAIRDPESAAAAPPVSRGGHRSSPAPSAASSGGSGAAACADDGPPAMTSRPRPGKRHREAHVEFYLSSDASAVIEHTKKVIVLEDDDAVHLADGAYEVYKIDRKAGAGVLAYERVQRILTTLDMEVAAIQLGGYNHFMAKEIHEQPNSLAQTMLGRVVHPCAACPAGRIQLGGLSSFVTPLRRSRRLLFIAAGSSFHGCLAARPLIEELTQLPVQLEVASDFLDRRCPLTRADACFFVSQSGETADTLRALEYAKECGAICVGVTNTVGSAIARLTDCGMHINAGSEIGVASTKAYSSQILSLVMVALLLSEDSASTAPRRRDIIAALATLPDAVRGALACEAQMKALAATLKDEPSMLLFGRGWNYATALEGALKVKEIALMHSEGILAGEVKHGPLALVDHTMPLLAIATSDAQLPRMESVCEQLRARGGNLVVLLDDASGRLAQAAATAKPRVTVVVVPRTVDCLQPIVNVVPLQLLAYHLTVLRGHNVDQPRNLAKSVTVE